MNRSSKTPITDELLSAYIDGLVTSEESARIEAAAAADPDLAWEIDSLRQTVAMVQALPPVALPRSFVLKEEDVADVLAARRARAGRMLAEQPTRATRPSTPNINSVWQQFLAFFNSGNLLLRNATAFATLFLVIVLAASPFSARPVPVSRSAASAQSSAPTSSTAANPMVQKAAPASAPSSAPSSDKAAADVQSAPAQTTSQGRANESTANAESVDAQAETQTSSAETAAETAPVAEMAVPQQQQEAATAPLARSAAPEAMRSGPENPSAFALPPAPNGGNGGIGGGGIAEPMMQAMPSDSALFESPASGDSSAEPASDAPMADEAAADESPDESSAVAEAAAPKSAVAEAPAEEESIAEAETEAGAETELYAAEQPQSEPTLQESAQEINQEMTQEMAEETATTQVSQSTWQLLRMILGGLTLLFGVLWLRSRNKETHA